MGSRYNPYCIWSGHVSDVIVLFNTLAPVGWMVDWKLFKHAEAQTLICRQLHGKRGPGTSKEIVSALMFVHVCLHFIRVCTCVCCGTRVTSVPAVLQSASLACPSDLQIPSLVRSTQSGSFFRMPMCYTSQHTHTPRHSDRHTTWPTQANCSLNQKFQHMTVWTQQSRTASHWLVWF